MSGNRCFIYSKNIICSEWKFILFNSFLAGSLLFKARSWLILLCAGWFCFPWGLSASLLSAAAFLCQCPPWPQLHVAFIRGAQGAKGGEQGFVTGSEHSRTVPISSNAYLEEAETLQHYCITQYFSGFGVSCPDVSLKKNKKSFVLKVLECPALYCSKEPRRWNFLKLFRKSYFCPHTDCCINKNNSLSWISM